MGITFKKIGSGGVLTGFFFFVTAFLILSFNSIVFAQSQSCNVDQRNSDGRNPFCIRLNQGTDFCGGNTGILNLGTCQSFDNFSRTSHAVPVYFSWLLSLFAVPTPVVPAVMQLAPVIAHIASPAQNHQLTPCVNTASPAGSTNGGTAGGSESRSARRLCVSACNVSDTKVVDDKYNACQDDCNKYLARGAYPYPLGDQLWNKCASNCHSILDDSICYSGCVGNK